MQPFNTRVSHLSDSRPLLIHDSLVDQSDWMAHPKSFFFFSSISFRVMSFIEKSVARLDQQDRLEALALELGKSHYHYNAPPKYYSVRPQ